VDPLALEVKNFDAASSSGTQPVPVGREDKCVDDVTSLQRVEVFAFVEVPEHGDTVFATRRCQRAVRGNRDSIDVTGVAVVVSLQLELGEFPDLEQIWAVATRS